MKDQDIVFLPVGDPAGYSPYAEFKALAAVRDALAEQLKASADTARSLARELLLLKLREWSEDVLGGSDAKRIEELAKLAGGWWVSPTEFKEDSY